MHYRIITLILSGILIVSGSCNREKGQDLSMPCDRSVIIDANEYQNAPGDPLAIVHATIEGDCLTITFASSGCDGSSWEIKLTDSGAVSYSLPPRRNLRLSLKNQEMCDAYIGRTVSFDIRDLRVPGNQVILNLTHSGKELLYDY